MNLIKTQVQCRGCQRAATIELAMPGLFSPRQVPFKCARCGSQLVAEVKRRWFQSKIDVRVKMVQHTKTLLSILNKRAARQNHA